MDNWKNKYGACRLVGYRGERDERIDAEHAEPRSRQLPQHADTKPLPEPVTEKKEVLQNEGDVSGTRKRVTLTTSDFGRHNEVASEEMIIDKMASKASLKTLSNQQGLGGQNMLNHGKI